MDRISELPVAIIHHILSLLCIDEAAKTSVLSKTWLHSWSTYPISDFDDLAFRNKQSYTTTITSSPLEDPKTYDNITEETNPAFNKFIDDCLQRYRVHNLRMKKFKLSLMFSKFTSSQIDNWIKIAIESQVEDLCLYIDERLRSYTLPQSIFMSKSVVVLKLVGCKLEKQFDTNTIEFRSLKKLLLKNVYLDDCVIQSLISSCPLIEQIEISYCDGLKKIHAANLCRLERVTLEIFKFREFESIHIDVPSLEDLAINVNWEMSWKIKLGSCRNLKRLCLGRKKIGDTFLHEFISQFPVLKFLELQNCNRLESMNISSNSLEEIRLFNCKRIVEAKIDAPNLRLFTYSGKIHPFSLSTTDSVVREAYTGCDDRLDALWLNKLKEFLTKMGHFEYVDLTICCRESRINMEELREISNHPPICGNIEELSLDMDSSLSVRYLDLLDGLFWICRPKTISVCLDSESNKNLVKNFMKELTELLMNKEVPKCCGSYGIKCWRHYLKDVEIYFFSEDDGSDRHREFRLKWREELIEERSEYLRITSFR